MARLEGNISSSGWNILIILSCLGLIVMFDETMILPAIPDFIHKFNISYSTSSWLLSAYIIAAAVMTPIGGKLSDIYGKKKILLIIMAIYAAGIMAGRFATNIEFMLTARIAQGVGMAMFPIAFGIIREVLPERKLAMGQTIFSSTFSGGNAIAVASVQLPFMIVLLIGTIMSGFILNKVKNTKLMLFGTAISTIGFFVLLIFPSTENMIQAGLTVLAAGLSLSITGAFNVILLSVPMQMTGIALGMTLLLNLVGMSVGPALSGVIQEAYKGTAIDVQGLFPTNQAYDLIFITAALVSLASVAMAYSVVRRKITATP